MDLRFNIQTLIERPIAEVFDAIRNPKKLEKYFATGGADETLETGKTVYWAFKGYPGKYPVKIVEVIPEELIVFEWESNSGGYDTRVEMRFEEVEGDRTMLSIAETGFTETPEGVEDSFNNCSGWTFMGCTLKTYLEHDIVLNHALAE